MQQKSDTFLKQQLTKHADSGSVLDELYWCYTQCNPINSPSVKKQFEKVYRSMPELPDSKLDEISNEIYKLSTLQESLAFQAGIKVGVRLALELLE